MSAKFWARFHASQILLWIGMIPVVLWTNLKTSVPFLVLISILSLIYGEFGSWQASRMERREDPHDAYGEEDDPTDL